jgi:hypothetical protein
MDKKPIIIPQKDEQFYTPAALQVIEEFDVWDLSQGRQRKGGGADNLRARLEANKAKKSKEEP